jgi:hypothetical protein
VATQIIRLKLVETPEGFNVLASVNGGPEVQSSINLSLIDSPRTKQVLERISWNNCSQDDIADVGSQLFGAVFSGEVANLLENLRSQEYSAPPFFHIRLSLPKQLAQLPWEAIYDDKKDSFLVSNPRYCIVREPPEGISPPRVREPGPLRLLAIIPDGSGLSVDYEWNNLNLAAARVQDFFEPERFRGRVTPDALRNKLDERAWDIIHYIGHGEISTQGDFTIRLNDEDEHDNDIWMDGEKFSDLFQYRAPILAVLNCCLGASPLSRRTLSGIAPALLRAGASAVIAMGYEVPDDIALKFANVFYQELLSGPSPGRVDIAVTRARQSMYFNSRKNTVRGFITPILYLAEGRELLFRIHAGQTHGTDTADRGRPIARPRVTALPPQLVNAIREQGCVPIVGPDVLRVDATRSVSVPLGPKELAKKLAEESQYPHMSDFDSPAERTDDWADGFLLAWVCQHYEKTMERFQLIKSVKKSYASAIPPESLQLVSSIRGPGIIYTHFDGLIESVLPNSGRNMRIVSRLDETIDVEKGVSLLVQLRGTIRDENSLILTEEDNEVLWDRLGKLPNQVSALIRGSLGCSALFLGLSPRDLSIRRLSSQLLDLKGGRRIHGPAFFVCPQEAVDDAYWGKYGVQWISMSLEDFFEALQEALK